MSGKYFILDSLWKNLKTNLPFFQAATARLGPNDIYGP